MAYDPANPQGNSQGSSPFNSARQQSQQQAQGQQQDQQDAMNRRYASMGMQNSGAAIQSSNDVARQTAEQQQNAQGNINLQEEQQSVPFALQGQQENFEAGQQSQRLGQQQGQFTQSQAQQQGEFTQSQGQQQQQFNTQAGFTQQGLTMEQQAQQFNEQMAQNEYDQSSNPFSGTNIGKMLGGVAGAGAGAGMAALFSDRRLKKNIRRLKKSIYKEVPTYLFEYIDEKFGVGVRVGTMAQDLLKLNPNHPAVMKTHQGYMVNYSLLERAL